MDGRHHGGVWHAQGHAHICIHFVVARLHQALHGRLRCKRQRLRCRSTSRGPTYNLLQSRCCSPPCQIGRIQEGANQLGQSRVALAATSRGPTYYTASSVTQAFFDDIVRFHGVPASIVSDRDPVFTSNFWSGLFHLAGVELHLSSAF